MRILGGMETPKAFLLFLAGGQGLLLSIALALSCMKYRKANVFLGVVLMVCSIELLNAWAIPAGYHHFPGAFPFWVFGSYLLLPPSLWFFIKANIHPAFRIKQKHLFLFAPALMEILTELLNFYLTKHTGFHIPLQQSVIWVVFTEILPVGWMIGVLVYYWLQLRKSAHLRVRQNTMHLYKQYTFLVAFMALTLLWMADSVFHLAVYSIIVLFLCVFLFILGYVVYFQPRFFELPLTYEAPIVNEPLFPLYQDEQELIRLKQLFEAGKLHQTARITVDQLAAALKLPERYVSYLINHYHQTNFNTYVNTWRVNEVIQKMNDPKEQHKTLLGLALEAGFNSKSSFNQIFKTITGKTPSSFLPKHRKED